MGAMGDATRHLYLTRFYCGRNGVRHLCAHNSLEASSNHFLTQLMNMSEDFTFPFGRRFLEAVDIVAQ